MCGIMVEYVQKDDVKIMSKVIGGVWTLSKYVWMQKGMEHHILPYITRLVGMHNEICLNAPNCGICAE